MGDLPERSDTARPSAIFMTIRAFLQCSQFLKVFRAVRDRIGVR